ncbi:TPA: hypothetical protein N0F65_000176 [Lagenidium giganteum]|uniref:Trichohyalin-plectin-homology domain-containing protein n=1 Tax=Lagenidium giganteum TaxID=4803 RepID=A0AAV2YRH9_9STRA|nr:TPA: hypothetical protein N0F65_000176 [Lagenidium giganteum]
MIGRPSGRMSNAGRASDTQSVTSITSMRTVDREKLREKARVFQMKENMRLSLCARIQHVLKKSPKVADELATAIMKTIKERHLMAAELTDEMVARLVHEVRHPTHGGVGGGHFYQEDNNAGRSGSGSKGERNPDQRRSSGVKETSSSRHARRKSKSSEQGRGGPALDTDDDNDIYITETQLQQRSLGFRLPPKVSPKKERGNGIWDEIVKFRSVEEEMERKRKQEEKANRRSELSSLLDAQVGQKKQQTQAEREAALQFHEQHMRRVERQDEEERRKERERLELAKQLNAIQQEQRRAKQQQLERERELKKAQETRAVEMLKKQQAEDELRDKNKKLKEKQRITQVLHENEQLLEKKRREKDKDRAYEVKLAEDYIKMEEAKDLARKKQLEDMANNIKARMKFFDDTAKADMDAKAREDEQRVLKYQQDYARQQSEAERKKREEAERRSKQQQQYLRLQMAEKKQREDATRKEINSQADLWRQERIEAERKERLNNQQRHLKNLSQQEILLQQIRDKELRSLEADQTQLEVQLNTGLLSQIHKQTNIGAVVAHETQNRSREVRPLLLRM